MADYASVLTGGSNNFDTTSEHLNALATDILEDGVVGSVGNTAGVAPMTGGLACNAQGTPNMTVAVTAGKCYVTATPSGQSSQRLRANISAQNATIAANSTGGTRYDWIYVKIDATNAANPNAAGDNVASIVVSRSTSSSTDNGTPPTYGYAIAVVTVANGASSITNGNITDVRESVAIVNNSSDDGWISLGDTPDTVTYNGNRSYDLVFNSVDLTDTVTPGARLKLTRTTAAPTQCTDLESSSSQYYSKSSPSGCTFTDDFTCMAWIKLESYTTATIVHRLNTSTVGWSFAITGDGHPQIIGATNSSNYRNKICSRKVPLGKWTHVAATLDLSGNVATFYVDGIAAGYSSSADVGSASALVQPTFDLRVGTDSTPSNYFDGKLAQVAVFSAVLSQSTIRSYMSQGLSGSETSLVSAYSFNNSITDLNTSNANNLTAQNGAVATATDSPFAQRDNVATGLTAGTVEYGIITAASYSTNTTLTVQVPEGSAIPTSGGVSAVSYSQSRSPFGFPASADKWVLIYLSGKGMSQASPVQNTWYNAFAAGANYTTFPIGSWRVRFDAMVYNGTGTGASDIYSTLSTTNNSESDLDFGTRTSTNGTGGAQQFVSREKDLTLTSATTYYLNIKTATASASTIYILGDQSNTAIRAWCNYL